MPSSKRRTRDYPEDPLQDLDINIHHRSHAEVEISTPNGSDDAVIPQTGIMLTREFGVDREEAAVRMEPV